MYIKLALISAILSYGVYFPIKKMDDFRKRYIFIKDMIYTLNVIITEVNVFKRTFDDITDNMENSFLEHCRTFDSSCKDNFYYEFIKEYAHCKSSPTSDICIRRCKSLLNKAELKLNKFVCEKNTTLRTDVVSAILICIGAIIIII